ncbi:hypothetical protein [Streptomyces sp. CA-111067]|uniref:hypothetical protein n=1 Tax=Streptomyces sp. CA-111067 TaxID=3240046 RepID=UPI003D996019
MGEDVWATLSAIEHALLICAQEATGILPYAEADIDESEDYEQADLVRGVLGLVDHGWVQVHRIVPWTSPEGRRGLTYGPPIPREQLPSILEDPATWDDPEDAR